LKVRKSSIGKAAIRDERLTPDRYADIFLKHVEAGAGFIELPFSIHVPDALVADLERKAMPAEFSAKPPRPNICMRPDQKSLSLYYIGGLSPTPQSMAGIFQRETGALIQALRKRKPKDIPLIGNVAGLGFFPETFITTAKAHEQAGVDLIELNLSTPGPVGLKEGIDGYFQKNFPLTTPGFFLGDQPDLVESTTREVVKAVNIPVGVKISPETGFPRVIELARRIRDAGAKFIVCSNLGIAIAPPNIYNKGKGKWIHIDGNPFCNVGGDLLRITVYKQVAVIAKFVSGIDIMACGGLVAPEHIVEAMMLGAKATQVVTGMLYRGRKIITKDIEFLRKYMKEQGYDSLEGFTGLALQYIKPPSDLNFQYELVAEVDPTKCSGCGICTDSICLSIYLENRLARVNVRNCTGCGICAAICPKEAIRLGLPK